MPKGGVTLQTFRQSQSILPVPSQWGIIGEVAGRRLVRGILIIESITDGVVNGTVNFRGTALPITGSWNENTRQIAFNSPFASFSGQLLIFDQTGINTRHFILNGNFIMNPPSLQAGEFGQWVALVGTPLTGPAQFTDPVPTTAAFLLSNLLYGNPVHFR